MDLTFGSETFLRGLGYLDRVVAVDPPRQLRFLREEMGSQNPFVLLLLLGLFHYLPIC